MKKIIFNIFIVIMAIVSLSACKSKQKTVAAYYESSDPQCLGVELDGTQTFYVWGTGKNKSDAQEQARKNAVMAVLFDGIRQGTSDCSAKPLVTEVNARERYEDYFDKFFRDGGKFKKFVSNKDSDKDSEKKLKGAGQEKFGMVIRVDRPKLKKQLIEDGILKQ